MLVYILPFSTLAQNTPGSSENEEVVESVFVPPDRHALKKLTDAQRLVSESRYREAVRLLGDILQSPEDYFFQPDKKASVYRSLRAVAESLIGQMPREGQELFELQYGAQARQMFNEALANGDLTRLAEVSRQFFHTHAGYQATLLLGLDHFDHNRPLAGALVLQRLLSAPVAREELEPTLSLNLAACWLRAGMNEKARNVLLALRRQDAHLRVTVGGREVPLFGEHEDPVAWLSALMERPADGHLSAVDNWLLFRGDTYRNASSTGSAPLLNFRWRVPIADEPIASHALNQYRRLCTENGIASLPALHPLAVDDVLLIRTLENLQAVDIATGKRLWESPLDEADDELGEPATASEQNRAALLTSLWGHRLWNDLTYGTLSSDGQYVFAVEDAGMDQGASAVAVQQRVIMIVGGPPVIIRRGRGEQVSVSNRLTARDIRNGKLVWELGGPTGPRPLPLAGMYFLGPPLPLMGQLYVLAETKNEIRLLALEAATGKLLWSQQLAVTDQAGSEALRRWAGMSPSYAEGVLVCPTSAGAVIGVDLATHALLWGVCYEQERGSARRRGQVQALNETTSGWSDGSVTISGERILLTPLESNWLYCLNLLDGELLWKCPRQNSIYLACAAGGKVVLVGSNSLRAVYLENGQPAWGGREQPFPDNALPSGRGFRIGENRYYLPLSNATVVAIDLDTGEITATYRSRKGVVPGNLICHRDKVFSQGQEGLDAFLQIDAAMAEVQRRLQADASDADALALQGELLLETGQPEEAVAALRRAFELKPSPRTRELLRDVLLDGLAREFTVYRQWSSELERMLEEDGQRATYLRLMAMGLRKEGQWRAAFQLLEQLADLATKPGPLEKVEADHYVRRDRWLQGQFAELLAAADKDSAQAIEQAISERLKTVLAASSLEPLAQFVACFGNLPVALPAREELVRRLKAASQVSEAELVSGELESERPSRKQLTAADWPSGKVEAITSPTKNPGTLPYNRQVLELRGDQKPWFHDAQFRVDQNRRNLIVLDGLGQEQWQVSFVEKGRPENVIFNPSWINLYARGRVLFFSVGWKMLAVESPLPGGEPRVLWQKSFSGDTLSMLDINQPGVLALPLVVQQVAVYNSQSNRLGPVNRAGVFYLHRDVVALDPRTGETLWVRSDLPNACDLFGDEEYLFVLRNDREEAVLLRAIDGELLGTRKIPRQKYRQGMPDGKVREVYSRLENSCLTTVGRKLLLFTPEGPGLTLKLLDPLDGREVWSHKFGSSARASLVNNDEAVAVLEQEGRLVIVNLTDGRIKVEQKLEPESNLSGITAFKSGPQYFVVTSNNPDPRRNVNLSPLPGQQSRQLLPIYEGRLYTLDESGKPFWPAPVKIQNQFLLAEQPESLPVIIFASQMYQQKPLGQGQWQVRILCVDKRNGRKAYEEEFNNLTGVFIVTGDMETKTIDLTMQHATVKLTFTDKSLPPPSEAESRPAKSSSESEKVRALWNAVLRALSGSSMDNQNRKPKK